MKYIKVDEKAPMRKKMLIASILDKIYNARVLEGCIIVSCDGAGPRKREGKILCGVGVVVCMVEDDGVKRYTNFGACYNSPEMTNIMAEFLAARDAFRIISELAANYPERKIVLLMDCQWVAEAIEHNDGVKPHLYPMQSEIQGLIGSTEICWIDRSLNVLADTVSKEYAEDIENSITL